MNTIDVTMPDADLDTAYNDAWARYLGGEDNAFNEMLAYGEERRRRLDWYLETLGDS
jgi:hypothetical protein